MRPCPDRRPFPDPDRPGIYRVPLGRGRSALIDARDVARVGTLEWFWCRAAHLGPTGYAYNPGRRLILARFIVDAGGDVDVGHLDGNRLDCRRANLIITPRWMTAGRSRKRKAPTSSQFKGVSFDREMRRWRVTMCVDGRTRHLGRFRDESAAAAAYDRAALDHFGPLARVNFPPDATGGERLTAAPADRPTRREVNV